MPWLDDVLDRLATQSRWSYGHGGPAATEPTALAALALSGHGRTSVRSAVNWLTQHQAGDGTLGVTDVQKTPCWPTSLAVLAWHAAGKHEFRDGMDRAIAWLVSMQGTTPPRKPHVGHDTTIPGWPWVAGTHSWIEPTALVRLALKAVGLDDHPRTRDAVRLIADRQLPSGGCNYGNTVVLGQATYPHVQPSGLAALALAGEHDATGRLPATLAYLERAVMRPIATASLCYALMGLAAHDRMPRNYEQLLAKTYKRNIRRHTALSLALLALAGLGEKGPLVQIARGTMRVES